MDNQKLAALIVGVAQYDGYNTSLLQTAKNLASRPENREFTSQNDRIIFEDLLRAINYASEQTELTVEVFKAINAQMNSKAIGQPEQPGVLRQNLEISVGDYLPPVTVTEKMVQGLLAVPDRTLESAWELYARLAKLQAFDDGNKRTALISANLHIGSLNGKSETYLTIPTDYRRARFDANLIDFYMADDWDDHYPDVQASLTQFVDFAVKWTLLEAKSN